MAKAKKIQPEEFIDSSHWQDEEWLEENAELLKALAHPSRLKIIGFLSSGKQCVKHIWESLDLPQPNVSQHLSVLRNKGILGYKREGSIVCYYIKNKKALEIYKLLTEEE
ncbi:metalloregulator ArsR/SmtB family transcription factor [Hydrogenivirga sp. 128-5-R1-1]|uniref:ArsR/SmtB family transcription factor n=1 Tax=Hydrogenivirga sp. 128-5-R1-1 TaxID=392423 RepID=UPI00015F3907|nr:metalloregulator ArsR/SmtB family transcription factor [Hydrogenivirga sp. 128-5-R1-1]EDP73423.1 transcriptional regulator, ArsR family protein [Hydrogenivirga sp. 128-5-R1-1]